MSLVIITLVIINYLRVSLNLFFPQFNFHSFNLLLLLSGPEESSPTFIKMLPDVSSIKEKEILELEVAVTGEPKPEIEWLKNGIILDETDRVILNNKGSTYQLMIKETTSDDAGNYTAVAKNKIETIKSNCLVNISTTPAFEKELQPAGANVGDDVTFKVTVLGSPKPDLSWSINGKLVENNERFDVIREGNDACLVIKSCNVEDAGVVCCLASNVIGEVRSETRLTVVKPLDAPSVDDDVLLEVDGIEGEDVLLRLPFSGESVTVRWFVEILFLNLKIFILLQIICVCLT